jgi:hypothetical protein
MLDLCFMWVTTSTILCIKNQESNSSYPFGDLDALITQISCSTSMLCCFSCIAAIDSPYFLLLSIIVIRIVSSPIAYQFRFFPLEQVSGPSSREVAAVVPTQHNSFCCTVPFSFLISSFWTFKNRFFASLIHIYLNWHIKRGHLQETKFGKEWHWWWFQHSTHSNNGHVDAMQLTIMWP